DWPTELPLAPETARASSVRVASPPAAPLAWPAAIDEPGARGEVPAVAVPAGAWEPPAPPAPPVAAPPVPPAPPAPPVPVPRGQPAAAAVARQHGGVHQVGGAAGVARPGGRVGHGAASGRRRGPARGGGRAGGARRAAGARGGRPARREDGPEDAVVHGRRAG